MEFQWLKACSALYLCAHVAFLVKIAMADITTSSTETVCPDGFHLFESSCYNLVSDPPLDRDAARLECESTGSHLIFVTSQSEQAYLRTRAIDAGVTIDYWMGLTYTDDVEHPHWLDGSELGNFTAWAGIAFNENMPCVRARANDKFLWDDRDCALKFGYICEIDNVNIPLTSPAPIKPAPTRTVRLSDFQSRQLNTAAPLDGQYHLENVEASSLIRCATYCLRNARCASFNYRSVDGWQKLTGFCELYSMTFPDDELVERRGYRHYRHHANMD